MYRTPELNVSLIQKTSVTTKAGIYTLGQNKQPKEMHHKNDRSFFPQKRRKCSFQTPLAIYFSKVPGLPPISHQQLFYTTHQTQCLMLTVTLFVPAMSASKNHLNHYLSRKLLISSHPTVSSKS